MLHWLQNLFARRTLRAPRRVVTVIRARYDAASTSAENRRHWANADGLSANAANSAEVRRILRNRARYEVANNSYAKGIVLTLANDVIGTGPRLQMLTDDAEVNRLIEQQFGVWAQAVGLAAKLRTLRMARASDGEGFGILTSNPKLTTQVLLDLRLVEADLITTPDGTSSSVDGIVFDAAGNPVEYHVLKAYPGEGTFRMTPDFDRVPAASVVHWFRADRPGQARGIPDITPALPLFAQLRRYTLAVLAAAETAADFAAFLKTDAPANGEAESAEPFESLEIEKRMLTTLPAGWDVSQLRAEQPTTSHSDFARTILNEIARCLNMPFGVAAGNSSGYNYASGRLDHQIYFKSIRVEQADLEEVVLDRLLTSWLREAALIRGYLPTTFDPSAELPHQWFWDGQEHVDPAKEASAQATRLANYTTTLADEYARRGQDWEMQLRQRAKEVALMNELGLSPAQAQPSTPQENPDATDQPPDQRP